MAVFTDVTPAQAGALTERLGAGALLQLQGIGAGIENTNFFVTTTRGDWVLTLFERLTHAEAPFYLGLMQHLARKGLPVPAPAADAAGQTLFTVAGKPATLVSRLAGGHHRARTQGHVGKRAGHTLTGPAHALSRSALGQAKLLQAAIEVVVAGANAVRQGLDQCCRGSFPVLFDQRRQRREKARMRERILGDAVIFGIVPALRDILERKLPLGAGLFGQPGDFGSCHQGFHQLHATRPITSR